MDNATGCYFALKSLDLILIHFGLDNVLVSVGVLYAATLLKSIATGISRVLCCSFSFPYLSLALLLVTAHERAASEVETLLWVSSFQAAVALC